MLFNSAASTAHGTCGDQVTTMAANSNRHKSDTNPTACTVDNFFSPINHRFYVQQPYQDLKSRSSIRLLKISRKPSTGRRIYTLTNEVPLSEARDTYTAISYCAGDPTDTRELCVNGIKFNAFASLARAIDNTCHYRTECGDEDIMLWTDQICINQSNLRERSHQVGMMYDVYETARDVAICLDTPVMKRQTTAFEWIRGIHKAVPLLSEYMPLYNHQEGLAWPTLWDPDSPETNYDCDIPEYSPGYKIFRDITRGIRSNAVNVNFALGFLDFCKILDADWWARAWVVQEFVASRDATFIVGHQYMPWRLLTEFVGLFSAMTTSLENSTTTHEPLRLFPSSSEGDLCHKRWRCYMFIRTYASQKKMTKVPAFITAGLKQPSGSRALLSEILSGPTERKASDVRDLMLVPGWTWRIESTLILCSQLRIPWPR